MTYLYFLPQAASNLLVPAPLHERFKKKLRTAVILITDTLNSTIELLMIY